MITLHHCVAVERKAATAQGLPTQPAMALG